jgi:hypothetical protein
MNTSPLLSIATANNNPGLRKVDSSWLLSVKQDQHRRGVAT